MIKETSFGRAIAEARKGLDKSQKELAALIKKEDGEAITPQYLNDIEHDRRSPSSDHLIDQFAKVLNMETDYLYFLAGRLPHDVRGRPLTPDRVSKLMMAFRKKG